MKQIARASSVSSTDRSAGCPRRKLRRSPVAAYPRSVLSAHEQMASSRRIFPPAARLCQGKGRLGRILEAAADYSLARCNARADVETRDVI